MKSELIMDCPTPEKLKFPDSNSANKYLHKINPYKRKTLANRSYPCQCGKWHITKVKSNTELEELIKKCQIENDALKRIIKDMETDAYKKAVEVICMDDKIKALTDTIIHLKSVNANLRKDNNNLHKTVSKWSSRVMQHARRFEEINSFLLKYRQELNDAPTRIIGISINGNGMSDNSKVGDSNEMDLYGHHIELFVYDH